MFGAGDEGGVVVKTRTSSEQSFYLTDDEKSIVIQDLLEELKVILYCGTQIYPYECIVRPITRIKVEQSFQLSEASIVEQDVI